MEVGGDIDTDEKFNLNGLNNNQSFPNHSVRHLLEKAIHGITNPNTII